MVSREKLRAFRAEFTKLIPWVTVLKRPKPRCAAYVSKWYKMSYKKRTALTVEERLEFRCKSRGSFRFRALKWSGAVTGTYCETHLRTAGIFSTMAEDERFRSWCDENSDQLNALRAKYGLPPVPTLKEELASAHQA